MRLIDEIAYQYKIAKIPMEERTFVKAWETAQDMPTIDAMPVVRGEWIKKSSELTETLALCSKCSYPISWWHKTNYCPNCGSYNGGDKA